MAIVFASVPAIRIIRGTTWSDDLQLVDKASGDPVNLTGITELHARIRASINGPILLPMSLADTRLVIVNAAQGRFGFRCPSEVTLLLPENANRKKTYIFDVVIERTVGEYEPAITSKLSVRPSITRPWGTT